MAELVSRVMLDAIEKEIVRQGSFFRDKFFSTVYAIPERVFEYDRITYNSDSLPFAGYEAESTTDAVKGFDTVTASFECIRHKHVITPFELENRLPGRTAYDTAEKIAELQNISYGELERALIRTEEKMAIQALVEGQVTVKLADGSTKRLAQYWDTPVTGGVNDPVITASSWASATGADMLEDILGWQAKIIEKGGAALGGTPLMANGTALLGSSSVSKMMYGPTYLPAGEQTMTRYIGRRSVYSIVSRDPVAIANVIQSAPLPLVRRKWDVLSIKGL